MQRILNLIIAIFITYSVYAQEAVLTGQIGHNSMITSTQFSPNGLFLASTSIDNTIKLWDIKTHRLIRTFNGHSNAVRSVVFTPDSKFILSASLDKSVIMWDIETGKKIREYDKHNGGVSALAISPNGNLIASGSWDKTIIVWSTTTGKVAQMLTGHNELITDLKFSNDGAKLASASDDNSIIVWDILSGNQIYRKTNHYGEVKYIAFTPDGAKLISQSIDNSIIVYNANSGQQIEKIIVPDAPNGRPQLVNSIVCTPNGSKYISIINGEKFAFWNSQNYQIVDEQKTSLNKLTALSISPKESILAAAEGNKIYLFNYHTKAQPTEIGGYSSIVSSVDVSKDAKMLVSGNRDKTVRLWDINSGRYLAVFSGHEEAVETVQFSKDNKLIVSAGRDNTIRTWDISDISAPAAKNVFKGHTDNVTCIDVRIDSKYIASGSSDKTVKMWKTETGEIVRSFIGHRSMIHAVSMSNDGKWLVSGSWDGEVIVWDIDGNIQKVSIKAHQGNVWAVKFAPDNRTLITGGADNKVKIWDAVTGQLINTLSGHSDYVKSIAISPDGQLIASGGWDSKIILWDLRSGTKIQTLEGHKNYLRSVSFSSDGAYLVSGSSDTQMKIWDYASGTELLSVITFTDSEDFVVTTPSGYFDGTPSGIKKALHFVKGTEVIPLDAFFEQRFTPNLWARVIAGEDFEQDRPVNFKLPPEVNIISPKRGFAPQSPKITISIEAVDKGGGVDEVRLYQNNKLVASTERGFKPISQQINKKIVDFNVQLVPGMNQFTAVAFNSERTESSPAILVINYATSNWQSNLHILAIGINSYRNTVYNLNYALTDAESFVKSVKKGSKKLYRKTNVHFIADEDATKENIEQAFAEIKQEAAPRDVFMFFYAGHGVMNEATEGDKSDFFFIPHDVTQMYGSNEMLRQKGISSDELMEWSKEIKAQKQLLLIDACQSGGAIDMIAQRGVAEQKALMQLARSTGTAVIASSGTEQVASEFKELGHGVFTYSIIEALDGKADGGKHDGLISLSELKSYIDERVPELTQKYRGQTQYPTGYVRGQEFPVVIVD